jgi:hypothetical protein
MEQKYEELFRLFKESPLEYEAMKKTSMYPQLDDPLFSEKILKKKEFGRFSSKLPSSLLHQSYDDVSKSMCSSRDFRLTANQNFVSNFLSPYTPYNGLLLYHSVGVGKTASAISIAERYYDVHKRRVLVILSGNIKDNFKKQIFDITRYSIATDESQVVTGTKYPDMVFDKDLLTPEALESKVNKLIKERYQFIGYKELVEILNRIERRVEKLERNPEKRQSRIEERIKETFSNRLIIIDEAHNLRMQTDVGDKKISKAFLKVLQTTDNTKVLLMTATPMFDDAKEIVWMLNLLLTNDKREPWKTSDIFNIKSGRLAANGKKKLQKIAHTYVSFMRGENPFTFPFRLMPSTNNDPRVIIKSKLPTRDMFGQVIASGIKHLELYGSVMSQFQRSVYDGIKQRVGEVISESESNSNSDSEDVDAESAPEQENVTNDIQNAVQISNVAYTSGIGKKGFEACINRTDVFRYKKNAEQLFAYENLAKYSPKIKSIVDCIVQSKGIIFVYSQYYYSGIYPLAMALEHIGFRKYNSNGITRDITVTNKFQDNKRPSYIILSRDRLASPNNDAEIAAAKSMDNADGSVIKVIIVSKIGTEGIDFKRIREVHLMEPWFNLNRIEQIIGRAVRTCSHTDLPIEDRNVTIYMHANQYDTNNSEESMDLRMYRISENKQLRIAEVERIFKESAIDCRLNENVLNMSRERLNRSFDIVTSRGTMIKDYQLGDQDNTFLCGYGKCQVNCAAPKTELATDESTFDPIFIANEIDLYKRYIQQMFKMSDKAYTFADIHDVLAAIYANIDVEILSYALDELIEFKQSFEDYKGTTGYVIYRGNKYIFQGENDIRATISERTKTKNRPGRVDLGVLATHLTNKLREQAPAADALDADASIIESLLAEVSFLKNIGVAHNIPEHIVYESAVDSLNEQNTLKLIKKVMGSAPQPDHAHIVKAMLSTKAFIVNGSKVTHFFNRFDDKVYSLAKMEPIGPLEISTVRKQYDELMLRVLHDIPRDIDGYIESKKKESKFKIKDNVDTPGYVCAHYSELKLEQLKELTNTTGVSKVNKKTLCRLYELQMRVRGRFERPWLLSHDARVRKN